MSKIISTVVIVLLFRALDSITTYMTTPDLKDEVNLFVMYLGLGWRFFIIKNIVLALLAGWCVYKVNKIPIVVETKNLSFKEFIATWMYKNPEVSLFWNFSVPTKNFIKKMILSIIPCSIVGGSLIAIVNNLIEYSAPYHPEIYRTFSWLIEMPFNNFILFMMTINAGILSFIMIYFLVKYYVSYKHNYA